MTEIQTGTSSNDPMDQVITIDMNTEYLARTYEGFLTKANTNIKDFYIENPLSEEQFRSYRYVASIATTESPKLPIENLVKLYSEDIWTKTFTEKDLEEIDKAITLIKISYDTARIGDAPINMTRDITLVDESKVNVEYVPYIEKNTDVILADMNQHLQFVE